MNEFRKKSQQIDYDEQRKSKRGGGHMATHGQADNDMSMKSAKTFGLAQIHKKLSNVSERLIPGENQQIQTTGGNKNL